MATIHSRSWIECFVKRLRILIVLAHLGVCFVLTLFVIFQREKVGFSIKATIRNRLVLMVLRSVRLDPRLCVYCSVHNIWRKFVMLVMWSRQEVWNLSGSRVVGWLSPWVIRLLINLELILAFGFCLKLRTHLLIGLETTFQPPDSLFLLFRDLAQQD